MRKSVKSLFYSVWYNIFPQRTNLIILFEKFAFKRKVRAQNFEIMSPKGTFHTHMEKIGKKQLLLSCQISSLFWHRKIA
jgi:hypothetical protein